MSTVSCSGLMNTGHLASARDTCSRHVPEDGEQSTIQMNRSQINQEALPFPPPHTSQGPENRGVFRSCPALWLRE